MAIDKDFVIRNGIEVNEDLIYADPTSNRVGIGTTLPNSKLEVNGAVYSTDSITSETLISSKDGSYTGIITANDGYEIGIGIGSRFIHVDTDRKQYVEWKYSY